MAATLRMIEHRQSRGRRRAHASGTAHRRLHCEDQPAAMAQYWPDAPAPPAMLLADGTQPPPFVGATMPAGPPPPFADASAPVFGLMQSVAPAASPPAEWSLPVTDDYGAASPSLSLGAPRTLAMLAEGADDASAYNAGGEDAGGDVFDADIAAINAAGGVPAPEQVAGNDPIDAQWQSRLANPPAPDAGGWPDAATQSSAASVPAADGHAIFDRMGRSRQQTLNFAMGSFEIDDHLDALEVAMAIDARVAGGAAPGVSPHAEALGDFDLLSEIASLTGPTDTAEAAPPPPPTPPKPEKSAAPVMTPPPATSPPANSLPAAAPPAAPTPPSPPPAADTDPVVPAPPLAETSVATAPASSAEAAHHDAAVTETVSADGAAPSADGASTLRVAETIKAPGKAPETTVHRETVDGHSLI